MTLTDALVALQAAGKIASAWLPGMLARENGFTMRLAYRTTGAWHCAYAHPEKPAMDGWLRVDHGLTAGWSPVLTDPATVGCLLALLREAMEDELAWVGPSHPSAWAVFTQDPGAGWTESGDYGETYADAIAAALIALAEVA